MIFLISLNLNLEIYNFYRDLMSYFEADEALTFAFTKFINIANVFLKNLMAKFSEHYKINNCTIH